MARPFDINSSIPIYAEYFYATSLDDSGPDIFNTNIDSFSLEAHQDYLPYDVVEQIITPLTNKHVLRKDGTKLLVPLEAQLILPDAPPASGKYPLLFILHGNHTGYARLDDQTFKPQGTNKGKWEITVLPAQKKSYTGYTEFQNTLSDKGIASYSINLNIVHDLDVAEQGFNEIALDANQRILLFFLHLKLLKLIAGESLPDDKYPIRFLEGGVFKNIKDALLTSSHTELMRLKTLLTDPLDFTKLGLMGHSRGADAVSRIPAYFFKGANPVPITFPKHTEVDTMIKDLAIQTGKPQQDSIKSILALQPVAAKNTDETLTHGYVIDSPHTMFFVGLGTHDEDVSFDPVRIYEHPVCPKAMIGINGATHKRFNTIWAATVDQKDFTEFPVNIHILDKPDHIALMQEVFARCFTSTLANVNDDFLYFTKERTFPVALTNPIDVQCSWKFGFPFGLPTPVLKDLDGKLTSLTRKNLTSTSFPFEQEVEAFVEQRENAGIFTIKIPIDPTSSQENLSKFTHFSFRFAKGYELSKNPERVEEKNFTIEFFENTNLVGKQIEGKDIDKIQLKAIRAFDLHEITQEPSFEYSILLQTAEIAFDGRFSTSELNKITSIEIKIVPDPKKSPPRPKSEVWGGSIAMGIVGGWFGLGGALVYNDEQDISADDRKWYLLGGGVGGAVLGAGITYLVLKSEENAFAFNDFLLTNRQFP